MADMAVPQSNERQILPANVKPFHYDLRLEPDFDTCRTEGSVSIDLDIFETSKSITLNVVDIKVRETILECGEDHQSPLRSE
jgi:aminopeptidase 2